jgi:large subunit ribosomal protein L7A
MTNNNNNDKKLVGAKQTLKAVKNGTVKAVYVATDADVRVTKSVVEACNENNIEIIYVESMEKLGIMCSIDVGAAIACALKKS